MFVIIETILKLSFKVVLENCLLIAFTWIKMGKFNSFGHPTLQGCFIWYLQFSSNVAGLFSCNKQGK